MEHCEQTHHPELPSSVSMPQEDSVGSANTSQCSPLLRLPFELRTHIYELVLGGHHFGIVKEHGKIASMRPTTPPIYISE